MNRRRWRTTLVSLLVFLLATAAIAAMKEFAPTSSPLLAFSQQSGATAQMAAVNRANFTTVITVTTTDDPVNDSLSRTCGFESGVY